MELVSEKIPIQLKYSEHDRKVVITLEDQDRFVLNVEEASIACRAHHESEQFKRQFNRLLDDLADWLRTEKNQVEKAFVTIRDAGLLLLIVRKCIPYDGEFEDRLSDLDIKIAQDPDYHLINLSVLALPKCSEDGYTSFLSHKYVMEYRYAG